MTAARARSRRWGRTTWDRQHVMRAGSGLTAIAASLARLTPGSQSRRHLLLRAWMRTTCGSTASAAQISQFAEDPDLTITATGMVRVDTRGVEIDRHVRPGEPGRDPTLLRREGLPLPPRQRHRGPARLSRAGWLPVVQRGAPLRGLWGRSGGTWLRFFKPSMVEEVFYSYRVSGGSVSSVHAAQQSAASQAVRRRFERLELEVVLPEMLTGPCGGLRHVAV